MSKETQSSEQSGVSRPVVVGGATVALAVAALFAWSTFVPQDDVGTAPAPTPSETAEAVAPEADAPAEEEVAEQTAPVVAETTAPPEAPAADPATEEVAETDQATEEAVDEAVVTRDPQPEPELEAATEEPPVFDLVRVEETGDAVIAGRAQAGGVVRILLDGVSVAETSADASGSFVALVSLDPSVDPRTLTLESIGESGEPVVSEETALVAPFVGPAEEPEAEIAAVEQPAELLEPSTPEASPAEAGPLPDASEVAAATEAPEPEAPAAEPEQIARVETAPQVVIVAPDGAVPQTPSAAPARPSEPESPNVVIDTISYDDEGEVILVGRAQPGNFVRLYLDNILTETATVETSGTWRSRVTGIDAGVYTLRADETLDTGRVVSRFETPFERVTRPRAIAAAEQVAEAAALPPDSPLRAAAGIVTVQPGFTLWAIARENYGDGVQYVRVFEANRTQIRDPDLIYPGQVFSVPEQ